MNELTVINLNASDMASYLSFRKHERAILALIQSKSLDLLGATVQFHIDRNGVITGVKVVDMPLYSTRGLTVTNPTVIE